MLIYNYARLVRDIHYPFGLCAFYFEPPGLPPEPLLPPAPHTIVIVQ